MLNFRKFEGLAARLERRVTEIEEKIQKFVDTSEYESMQKCEIFDSFSNSKMKQTCLDHSSKNSYTSVGRFDFSLGELDE